MLSCSGIPAITNNFAGNWGEFDFHCHDHFSFRLPLLISYIYIIVYFTPKVNKIPNFFSKIFKVFLYTIFLYTIMQFHFNIN